MQRFNLVLSLFLALFTIGCKGQTNTPSEKKAIVANAQASLKAPRSFSSPKFRSSHAAFYNTELQEAIFQAPYAAIDYIILMTERSGKNKDLLILDEYKDVLTVEEYEDVLTFVFKILSQLPPPASKLPLVEGTKKLAGVIRKQAKAISEIPSKELFPMKASLPAITPEDWEQIRKFLPGWFSVTLSRIVASAKRAPSTKSNYRYHRKRMKILGLEKHFDSSYEVLKKKDPSL